RAQRRPGARRGAGRGPRQRGRAHRRRHDGLPRRRRRTGQAAAGRGRGTARPPVQLNRLASLRDMKSFDVAAVVTGGASGLGEATTRALAAEGAAVTILDLQEERGAALAAELGGHTTFVRTDVTDEASVQAAIEEATGKDRPLRIAVNCAGIGWAQRTVARDGAPHDLGAFTTTVMVNLVGTFNVLRLAAAAMT